jgi:hypothetical protein
MKPAHSSVGTARSPRVQGQGIPVRPARAGPRYASLESQPRPGPVSAAGRPPLVEGPVNQPPPTPSVENRAVRPRGPVSGAAPHGPTVSMGVRQRRQRTPLASSHVASAAAGVGHSGPDRRRAIGTSSRGAARVHAVAHPTLSSRRSSPTLSLEAVTPSRVHLVGARRRAG